MKKLMMAVAVAACAAETFAMPTKQELTTAQPLVVELMADDVAAFKAKTKKAEEVGDVSVKYAQEASTEAAKFLLLKGAISYYVRAGQYDKAADTVNALKAEIADVPPAVIEEIIRKNTVRVTAKKAPRLFAQYQTAQVQMAAAKEVAAAKSALAKKPNDAALTRKLAEAQALSGNWKAALESFAQLNNKAGATAQAESEGKNLPDVADFWWAYESYLGEDDADVFKSHAAEIYKKCLADGTIEGLKKNIVEKRLKQVEIAAAPAVAIEKTEKTVDESPDKIVPKVAKQGKGMKLKIRNGVEIEFVQCPAGSFVMGKQGDDDTNSCTRCHKVNITRPFWMSKTQVTCAQWEAFEKPRATAMYQKGADRSDIPVSFVTYDQATEYCGHLNRRFKSQLPRGCVIRLPTEAEWEYALTAGVDDFSNPYIQFRDGSFAEKEEVIPKIAATRADMKKEVFPIVSDWIKEKSDAKEDAARWIRCRVAKKLPNNWGLYDMLSNGAEITLDTVWQKNDDGNHKWGGRIHPISWGNRIRYDAEETDPLRLNDHPGRSACVVRGVACDGRRCGALTPDWHNRDGVPTDIEKNGQTFRLVVGPDLVSEWRAKHGKE